MQCRGCEIDKPEESFPLRKEYPSWRRRPYCYECSANIERMRYESHKRTKPFKHKASRAKSRASGLKVPFDLDEDYLESIWTGVCPVYGVKIEIHGKRGNPDTAELDRIIPKLGYVKGNVRFLSRKANAHKNNMTLEEVKLLAKWMEKIYDENSG